MSQREQVKSIIIAKTSEIVDQSTFHGVTKIFNTKSKPIKFIWSSYFIVSFCLCAYFVINTLTNYFQWSVITNIDNIYERAPQFPAVTVCSNGFINNEDFLIGCLFNQESCLNSTHLKKNNTCYFFNTGFDNNSATITPLNSLQEGFENGLQLSLFNENIDTYFKVYVNNYTQHIEPIEGIKVSFDFETSLIVTRLLESKLPSPYNFCEDYIKFTNEQLSHLSYPYYQSECYNLCRLREVAIGCGELNSFEKYADDYYLNLSRFHSSNEELLNRCNRMHNDTIFEEVERRFLDQGEHLICGNKCPIKCNTITYSIAANYNPLSETELANVTRIIVYYNSFKYVHISQMAKTKAEDLFAGIGGILGLFMGVSLLSFVEVIELLISYVVILAMYSGPKSSVRSQNTISARKIKNPIAVSPKSTA